MVEHFEPVCASIHSWAIMNNKASKTYCKRIHTITLEDCLDIESSGCGCFLYGKHLCLCPIRYLCFRDAFKNVNLQNKQYDHYTQKRPSNTRTTRPPTFHLLDLIPSDMSTSLRLYTRVIRRWLGFCHRVTYKYDKTFIYGWMSKCWFLDWAVIPQLHWGPLHKYLVGLPYLHFSKTTISHPYHVI